MLRILLPLAFVFTSTPAMAQLLVIGNGQAASCYSYAKTGNQGSHSAIKTCQAALNDPIGQKDIAATHVNLGLLLMRKGELEKAEEQYKIALDMRPETTEVYINYGAALIQMNREDEALDHLNKALELNTPRMIEALYNRAIIYHQKEKFSLAYKDLKTILDMSPEFEPAKNFIDIYDVVRTG